MHDERERCLVNEGKPCILVVDDYRPILLGLCEILEARGYTALPAHSGREALEVMGWVRPDLILADVMMPGMNGFELFDKIQSRPEWQTIPVIFVTGLTDEAAINRARELGVDAYLTKPIRSEELMAVVREQLERGAAEQRPSLNGQGQDIEAQGDAETLPN